MMCWTPDRLAAVCRLFGVWAVAVGVCPAVAQVQLSELVSDNSGGLRDEEGEASDWVEIYNAGDSPVLLAGWGLSDRLAEPFKWVFPERTQARPWYCPRRTDKWWRWHRRKRCQKE